MCLPRVRAIFPHPSDVRGCVRPRFSVLCGIKVFSREFICWRRNELSRRAFSRGANFAAVCIRHYEARGNPGVLLREPERYRAKRDDAINNAPPCEVANNKCECTKFCRMKVWGVLRVERWSCYRSRILRFPRRFFLGWLYHVRYSLVSLFLFYPS